MSVVSNNIKYLRRLNGLTQEQFARRIGIKRSLLGAYEEARANPNLDNLMSIARAFNTTVDNLLKQDLRKIRETPDLSIPLDRPQSSTGSGVPLPKPGPLLPEVSDHDLSDHEMSGPNEPQPLSNVLDQFYRVPPAQKPQPPAEPFRRPEARPAEPPVAPVGAPARASSIHLVAQQVVPRPVSVNEGRSPVPMQLTPASQPLVFNNVYEGSVRQDPSPGRAEKMATDSPSHPAISLVRLNQAADYQKRYQQADFLEQLPQFSLPLLDPGHYRAFEAGTEFTLPGALLIGQFVRNWFDIADGRQYIVMVQHGGLLFRRIFNQVKAKGTLLLTSDKPDIPNREVPIREVQEIWEIKAFVSQQLPDPPPSLDRMRSLLDEMKFELDRVQGNP